MSWRVSQQRTLDGTRPDVLFERLDAPGPRLAVYLDGYEYHAGPRHNRLADDAVKRARLRTDGLRVFQLTYFDVKDWRRLVSDNGHAGGGPNAPVWRPYGPGGDGEERARKYYANVRSSLPGELSETVWVNPANLLLAYLRSPGAARWQWRAEAAVAGLTGVTGARAAALTVDAVGPQVRTAVGGGVPAGPRGPVQIITAPDRSGLRLVLAADGRRTPPVWSALAVLDDAERVHDDEPSHKQRWRSWLFWTNLLQFLEHGGGDSVQLTTGLLDGFSVETLTVSGGDGWLASTRQTPVGQQQGPKDVPEGPGRVSPAPSYRRSARELPQRRRSLSQPPSPTRRGSGYSNTSTRTRSASPSSHITWRRPVRPLRRAATSSTATAGRPNSRGPKSGSASFSLLAWPAGSRTSKPRTVTKPSTPPAGTSARP